MRNETDSLLTNQRLRGLPAGGCHLQDLRLRGGLVLHRRGHPGGASAGFRIRIDLMRIRIRIRIQHFFLLRIRIPDPDPGFDDLKLEKIYN